MNKELFIMQGVSGSGKSTTAHRLITVFHESVIVYSTDDFWMQGGEYCFDVERLSEAHEWNQERARKAMRSAASCVVIDNTNITQASAQPYIDMADEFGYEVTVVRVDVPLSLALTRNATRTPDRQIPESVIQAQFEKMERIKL